MKLIIYTICFFILSSSIYAAPEDKKIPSQGDVLFWGFTMFVIAMGSMLFLVYFIPKLLGQTTNRGENPNPFFKKTTMEVPPKESSGFIKKLQSFFKKDANVKPQSEINLNTKNTSPKVGKTSGYTTPKEEIISDPQEFTFKEGRTESFSLEDSFEVDLSADTNSPLDELIKEFLSKLNSLVVSKAVGLYFAKDEQFQSYMEKSGSLVVKNESDKSSISEEIIGHLKKKQGAYSSDHTEAILPMLNEGKLFGAIKFKFDSPIEKLDINLVWGEIKNYTKKIVELMQTPTSEDHSLYHLEEFYKTLENHFNQNTPQNLTLVKVLKGTHIGTTLHTLESKVPELVNAEEVQLFRISVDTVAIFFSIEERDVFSKSLKTLLPSLKKEDPELEICVGSADYHSSLKQAQKWYERTLNTLNEAIGVGPNNYRLYKVQ